MATEEPRQEEQAPLPRDRKAVDWWLAKWGRTEPLTREDVERLIDSNGGTPEGLSLIERDMRGLDGRPRPSEGGFHPLNLQSARLRSANLQGAVLGSANLQGADLRGANFEGFDDQWTNLEDVRLYGATIAETTRLRRVLWGEKMMLGEELGSRWGEALDAYRDLKQWHQRTGDYDTAGKFRYREWECKRKLAQQQKKPVEVAELWLYRLLSSYGERPWRVIGVGAPLSSRSSPSSTCPGATWTCLLPPAHGASSPSPGRMAKASCQRDGLDTLEWCSPC